MKLSSILAIKNLRITIADESRDQIAVSTPVLIILKPLGITIDKSILTKSREYTI